MNILVFAGLSDKKLTSKLESLLNLPQVKEVFLVRNRPLVLEKVRSITPSFPFNFPVAREVLKFRQGWRLLKTHEIDCIIGIFLRPHCLYAFLLSKIFKKPVIYLLIGNDVDFLVRHPRIFRSFFKQASAIGVRGPRSKERLQRVFPHPIPFFQHNNVYDIPDQDTAQSVPGSKDIDILTIADFSRVKRIDIFLNVISRLKNDFPNIRAVMLGGGRRASHYQKMRTRMGLESHVFFEGVVPDVRPSLERSRIFVLTSEAEGLPMAMIEAMSAGLPCVVPDVGDITSIARDGQNAFVVKPRDVDEFAEKIITLLHNQELLKELGQNAKETIQNKKREFSLDFNARIWEKILEKSIIIS